jgi:hypothetical protein
MTLGVANKNTHVLHHCRVLRRADAEQMPSMLVDRHRHILDGRHVVPAGEPVDRNLDSDVSRRTCRFDDGLTALKELGGCRARGTAARHRQREGAQRGGNEELHGIGLFRSPMRISTAWFPAQAGDISMVAATRRPEAADACFEIRRCHIARDIFREQNNQCEGLCRKLRKIWQYWAITQKKSFGH